MEVLIKNINRFRTTSLCEAIEKDKNDERAKKATPQRKGRKIVTAIEIVEKLFILADNRGGCVRDIE